MSVVSVVPIAPKGPISAIARHIVDSGDPGLIAWYLEIWEREARAAARSLAWYGRRAKALRAAMEKP